MFSFRLSREQVRRWAQVVHRWVRQAFWTHNAELIISLKFLEKFTWDNGTSFSFSFLSLATLACSSLTGPPIIGSGPPGTQQQDEITTKNLHSGNKFLPFFLLSMISPSPSLTPPPILILKHAGPPMMSGPPTGTSCMAAYLI